MSATTRRFCFTRSLMRLRVPMGSLAACALAVVLSLVGVPGVASAAEPRVWHGTVTYKHNEDRPNVDPRFSNAIDELDIFFTPRIGTPTADVRWDSVFRSPSFCGPLVDQEHGRATGPGPELAVSPDVTADGDVYRIAGPRLDVAIDSVFQICDPITLEITEVGNGGAFLSSFDSFTVPQSLLRAGHLSGTTNTLQCGNRTGFWTPGACTITFDLWNVATSTLAVKKSLAPATDHGRFDLLIDDRPMVQAAGDGAGGQREVAAGVHTVSEASALDTDGAATSLSRYASTIACVDSTGATIAQGTGPGPLSVNAAPDEQIECTITNTLLTSTVEVRKQLTPATDTGRFDLLIDATTFMANAGNGDTTGPVRVTAGAHTVAEQSGLGTDGLATPLARYVSSVRCVNTTSGAQVAAADGPGPLSVTVAAGESVVCTVANARDPARTLTVAGGYIYSGEIGAGHATAFGVDKVTVHGTPSALSRVASVCLASSWSATVDLAFGSSVGVLWNGQPGPAFEAWKHSKPKGGLFTKLYSETVFWGACAPGVTATIQPTPFGRDLLAAMGGTFIRLGHTLSVSAVLDNGQILPVVVAKSPKVKGAAYTWAKHKAKTFTLP
jgi:hypothetical protein